MGVDFRLACGDCCEFIDLHKWQVVYDACQFLVHAHYKPNEYPGQLRPEDSPYPFSDSSTLCKKFKVFQRARQLILNVRLGSRHFAFEIAMTTRRGLLAAAMLTGVICAVICLSMLLRANVTRANFCLLKNGMPPAEVEEIFGAAPEPWIFSGSHRSGEIPLMWTGDGVAHIMFDVDRGLVHKVWSEEGFSSPTKMNFDRVEIGMTVAEVKKIFGKKPDSYWHSPNEVTIGRWRDIDGCGSMDFDHGRVRQKFWEGGYGEGNGRAEILFERFLRVIHLN